MNSAPVRTTQPAPAWLDDDSPQPAHTHDSHARPLRTLLLGVGLWALSLGGIAQLLGTAHTLAQMGGFFTQAVLRRHAW